MYNKEIMKEFFKNEIIGKEKETNEITINEMFEELMQDRFNAYLAGEITIKELYSHGGILQDFIEGGFGNCSIDFIYN